MVVLRVKTVPFKLPASVLTIMNALYSEDGFRFSRVTLISGASTTLIPKIVM